MTVPGQIMAMRKKGAPLLLGYPSPSVFIMGLREGLRDLGYEEGRNYQLHLLPVFQACLP
jgi:hypothetical protein